MHGELDDLNTLLNVYCCNSNNTPSTCLFLFLFLFLTLSLTLNLPLNLQTHPITYITPPSLFGSHHLILCLLDSA